MCNASYRQETISERVRECEQFFAYYELHLDILAAKPDNSSFAEYFVLDYAADSNSRKVDFNRFGSRFCRLNRLWWFGL